MNERTEDKSSQPKSGQPDTVTLTTQQYRLLTEIAETVVKMGDALAASGNRRHPVGFQSPNSRLINDLPQASQGVDQTQNRETTLGRRKPLGWATADGKARNADIRVRRKSSRRP
ncbi:MAG: hypothetical protein AAB532_00850 [Patescibacteria group bacterium]